MVATASATPFKVDPDPGTGGGTVTNAGAAPGSPYQWVGSAGDVNTATGNKVTSVPLVSWTARGGMPVNFALSHNSEETYSNFNGRKWTFSYLDFIYIDPNGNTNAYWDDGSYYTYGYNGNQGVYTDPAGIHNTLTGNQVSGNFKIVTKDQITYTFGRGWKSNNTLIYPNYWFLTSIADENGNTITINYVNGSNFTISSIVDPTGRTISLNYDTYGRLSTVTDPLGRKWTLGYNSNSYVNCDLTGVTFPAINGTSPQMTFGYGTATYDPDDITSLTDLRGKTSSYTYTTDGVGSIASETDPAGLTTGFSYTSTTATVTDPNHHTRVDTYDTSGRLTSVQDAEGFSDSYMYDADNNILTHKDRNANANAGGGTWTYTYDTGNANPSAHGNLLSELDPRNKAAGLPATKYTYTAHNRLQTVTKPSSTKVTLGYDGLDNLTSVVESYTNQSGNSVMAATTTFAYPSPNVGLPSSRKDNNGHVTTYQFGLAGNLYQVSTPLGKTTTWYYDTLGFPTKRVDAMNRTTTYTPDAWERLAAVNYPDGSQHTYGYDNDSNLTAFADAAVGVTRTYDDDNRLLTESYGGAVELSNTYDAAGQLGLRATSAHGTQTVRYNYTPRNELYQIVDSAGMSDYAYNSGGQTYYGYDADGNQDQQTLANGARVGKLFDADSSLTEVNNVLPNGTTVASRFNYAYDLDGRKATGTDSTGSSTTWGYDGQSHLNTDARTGGYAPYHDGYALDAVGNRTATSNVYGTFPYLYDTDDELTNYANGGYVFGYNANGDMTTSTINGHISTFSYDYDDQLTSLSSQSGTVSYEYDAIGRRIYRQDASGIGHTFVFDGSQIVAEYNDTSQVWDTEYTYGYDLLDKRTNSGSIEYPLYNGQGDVFQTLNASGSYVLSGDVMNDFGQGFGGSSGTEDLAYQWRASSGYRSDGDGPWTGAYDEPIVEVGVRYYMPAMGIFITRDKDLAEKPYEYCNADPVNNVDPSGYADKPKPGTTYTVNPDGTVTVTTVSYDSKGNPITTVTKIPALPNGQSNPNLPTQGTATISVPTSGGTVSGSVSSGANTSGSVNVAGNLSSVVTLSVGGTANLTGPISSSATVGIGYTFGFGKVTIGMMGITGKPGSSFINYVFSGKF